MNECRRCGPTDQATTRLFRNEPWEYCKECIYEMGFMVITGS